MLHPLTLCLDATDAHRFLKRTLFHPGSTKCEEQKREAREDYGKRWIFSLHFANNFDISPSSTQRNDANPPCRWCVTPARDVSVQISTCGKNSTTTKLATDLIVQFQRVPFVTTIEIGTTRTIEIMTDVFVHLQSFPIQWTTTIREQMTMEETLRFSFSL